MSRTYRAYPSSCVRHPRGHLRALKQGERSVPPSAWEDVPHNPECYIPQKVVWRFLAYGMDQDQVVEMVSRRFQLPRWQVREIARHACGQWRLLERLSDMFRRNEEDHEPRRANEASSEHVAGVDEWPLVC